MTRKPIVFMWIAVLVIGIAAVLLGGQHEEAADSAGTYDVRATAIEACSCPLFCSCYYNPEPSGGHKCEFNLAYKFEDGSHWGETDLSGAKVWLSGDLGDHFGKGKTDWAVVTFDNATTPEQRAAINSWIGKVFDVEWEEGVDVRTDDIEWNDDTEAADGAKIAHAKMASGTAEVTLRKVINEAGEQAMAVNTKYWYADSNEGFLLAHSTHYFHGEKHSYDYEKRNGFLITSRVSGEVEMATEAEASEAQ